MKSQHKALLFLFILISFSSCHFTQENAKELTEKENANELTEKEKVEVINSICNLLRANYVFPEVAEKISTILNTNLENGNYQLIIQPGVFAKRLTQDIRSVNNDPHLIVYFDPRKVKQHLHAYNPFDILQSVKNNEELKRGNYGFKEVKILDGNIGYLDLRRFEDTCYARDTAIKAMNFLSNADALIIDLRYNPGGAWSMIQLITSYFYSSEPVHLNSFYWRQTNSYTETWTLPYVPGKRRPDIDLYVLTSSSTFSGAEEFAYNLKNLKRATLIGETTKGGAHPSRLEIATERFVIWIPIGRAINPITKTNWEGIGVEPHIKTTKEEALNIAKTMALEKLKKHKEKN